MNKSKASIKYPDLNATAVMNEVSRLRRHIVLYKEVNPDEKIANGKF